MPLFVSARPNFKPGEVVLSGGSSCGFERESCTLKIGSKCTQNRVLACGYFQSAFLTLMQELVVKADQNKVHAHFQTVGNNSEKSKSQKKVRSHSLPLLLDVVPHGMSVCTLSHRGVQAHAHRESIERRRSRSSRLDRALCRGCVHFERALCEARRALFLAKLHNSQCANLSLRLADFCVHFGACTLPVKPLQ